MADGLTATKIKTMGKVQFQRMFQAIPFKVTFEDDSILKDAVYDGGGTVSVTGAKLGDLVWVAPELDPADLDFSAYVSAADTVTIVLNNNTGGTLTTFASGAVMNGLVLSLKEQFWNAGNFV